MYLLNRLTHKMHIVGNTFTLCKLIFFYRIKRYDVSERQMMLLKEVTAQRPASPFHIVVVYKENTHNVNSRQRADRFKFNLEPTMLCKHSEEKDC